MNPVNETRAERTAEHYIFAAGTYKLLAFTIGTIGVFGFCNNVVVIVLYCKFKRLRTPTNLLLVNISLSDLLVSVIGINFTFASCVKGGWTWSQATCIWDGFSNSLFGEETTFVYTRKICVSQLWLSSHKLFTKDRCIKLFPIISIKYSFLAIAKLDSDIIRNMNRCSLMSCKHAESRDELIHDVDYLCNPCKGTFHAEFDFYKMHANAGKSFICVGACAHFLTSFVWCLKQRLGQKQFADPFVSPLMSCSEI